MTQLVAVQTDFRDIDQMAQGLAGRVHSTHVILPAGEAVDEGEWAHFEIVLQDGSAGLAGLGRCVTVVDNGEERMPHQRFDVVIDSLQFDTHEQSVFEHVLALHGEGEIEHVSDADAESVPPASFDDAGGVDVSTDFSGSVVTGSDVSELSGSYAGSGDDSEGDDERTMIASADEIHALSEPDSLPPPGGEANDIEPHAAPHASPMAARGSHAGGASYGGHGGSATAHAISPAAYGEEFEEPVSGERIAPVARAVNGALFTYSNGIPIPANPPRPELDAALRVTPAPRPAGSSSH